MTLYGRSGSIQPPGILHRGPGCDDESSARQGKGPTLLECLTYRWFGHHEGDPGTSYRTKEEIVAWRKKDPVARLRERAIAEGWATEAEFKDADSEVNRVIQDAATFAVANPQPDISTALEHVFSN